MIEGFFEDNFRGERRRIGEKRRMIMIAMLIGTGGMGGQSRDGLVPTLFGIGIEIAVAVPKLRLQIVLCRMRSKELGKAATQTTTTIGSE